MSDILFEKYKQQDSDEITKTTCIPIMGFIFNDSSKNHEDWEDWNEFTDHY